MSRIIVRSETFQTTLVHTLSYIYNVFWDKIFKSANTVNVLKRRGVSHPISAQFNYSVCSLRNKNREVP